MATIKKRGNSYLFRCYDGYTQDGRQKERTMTWKIPEGMSEKKAEKEALHQASLFEESVRKGLVLDTKIKFSDFAEKWFSDYADCNLRKTTLARYHDLMKRILPVFGHMYMDRIRPAHLMTFYQELATTTINEKAHCKIDLKEYLKSKKLTKVKLEELSGVSCSTISAIYQGKNIEKSKAQAIAKALNTSYDKLFDSVGGSNYSAKTVQHYHRLLSSIFEKAVKWQYIVSNPCERVDPPKVQKVDPSFLDQDEAVKMLDYLQTEPTNFRCAIEVLLYTGMRRGELLGLKWSDVDFENQLINIHQTSLYLKEEGIFEDSTKNYSSERILKVPSSVILSLKNMQAWQDTQKDIMCDNWNDSGFIFTALDGSPMHPDTLSGWFHRFIESTDLPKIHLHSLRHTNATLMISNGVAVTTVAGQLGHANASTTTKIYAHAIKSAQAHASEVMEDLLKHSTITTINQKVNIG